MGNLELILISLEIILFNFSSNILLSTLLKVSLITLSSIPNLISSHLILSKPLLVRCILSLT